MKTEHQNIRPLVARAIHAISTYIAASTVCSQVEHAYGVLGPEVLDVSRLDDPDAFKFAAAIQEKRGRSLNQQSNAAQALHDAMTALLFAASDADGETWKGRPHAERLEDDHNPEEVAS